MSHAMIEIHTSSLMPNTRVCGKITYDGAFYYDGAVWWEKLHGEDGWRFVGSAVLMREMARELDGVL
jgi:hypothetical protein